jgi:hypothetical protein
MTKFNPENKDVLTYGECLFPAMEIVDKDDADQYFKSYVDYTMEMLRREPRNDDMTAEQICKTNIGYWAGYYGSDVRERVERLFGCAHPIFGSISQDGKPSNAEAYQCGVQNKTLKEIRQ